MPSLMSKHDRKYQFFETPPHYIAALFGAVNIFGRVYEPCVGEGAIADALKKLPSVRKVVTNDIDKKRKADFWSDARLTWYDAIDDTFDWAITNPPFSDEFEILQQALDRVPNVAFLARLSFLEPTEERAEFLDANPPNQIIVLPRYSFRPNDNGKRQTDSVTCAWLVWYEDRQPRRTEIWGRGKSQAYAIMRDL